MSSPNSSTNPTTTNSSSTGVTARVINIDLGAPLIEVVQSVTTSRLNEAVRVMLASLNNHEQLIQQLLARTTDMERKQESMQRELNRIAPQAGASSAELLEQILELKRELAGLSEKSASQNRDLTSALGGRLTTAEEAIKSGGEQRTRDLIAREKDFTQLTGDMQKLSTRLNALVIPDVQPLETAQRSLAKRMDEAEKLVTFASSFAAVWDADSARVEAMRSAATEDKVEYVHSLPPMKVLRGQMMQELRVQAVERLEMLTHELRDKVDLHKLTDLLGAVDEQLNELRVEDGRQERRLVSLEQGPLRISSIEDTLRRLQQSKADVSSLDLKADLAALQGLLQSINTIQDDINDLYDRVPRGSHASGGGGGDVNNKSTKDRVSFANSSRPSQANPIPQMPTAASSSMMLGKSMNNNNNNNNASNADVQALERRMTESEMQIKRLDDLKANRSELLRLHEYLDSKLQNFSALTSSAVAQANAAANAASRSLETAAKRDNQQNNNNNISNPQQQQGDSFNNNNISSVGDDAQTPGHPTITSPTRGSTTPLGAGYKPGRQPAPPQAGTNNNQQFQGRSAGGSMNNNNNNNNNNSMNPASRHPNSPLNQSVFSQLLQNSNNNPNMSPHHRQYQQGLGVDGYNPLNGGTEDGINSNNGNNNNNNNNTSPTTMRRSPLPTARIGNSWHIGRSSVAIRDAGGVCIASACLVPKFDENTMNEKEKARSRSGSLVGHSVDAPGVQV